MLQLIGAKVSSVLSVYAYVAVYDPTSRFFAFGGLQDLAGPVTSWWTPPGGP